MTQGAAERLCRRQLLSRAGAVAGRCPVRRAHFAGAGLGHAERRPFTGLPADNPAALALFANTAFTGALVQGTVAQLSGGNVLLNGAEAAALAGRLNPAHVETSNNTADLDSFDLFADATFKATDRWEISTGLRYTEDEKPRAGAAESPGAAFSAASSGHPAWPRAERRSGSARPAPCSKA